MATYTHTWAAMGSVVSLLSTGLNALESAGAALSDAIDNTSTKATHINLELLIAAQAGARTAGGYVKVELLASVDGTNYNDATSPIPELLCVFPLDAAVTARYATRMNLPIPPSKFKLQLTNVTGQAFAATGNTLKYTIHSEETTDS